MPPTPTPIPFVPGPYSLPPFSIWMFTDGALQTWHSFGAATVFIQAVLIVGIVAVGALLVLNFLKRMSNQQAGE